MICSRNFTGYLLLLNILLFTACSGVKDKGQGRILVSTGWLREHMNDPDLILLHAGSSDFYDSIHIPGARLELIDSFYGHDGFLIETPVISKLVTGFLNEPIPFALRPTPYASGFINSNNLKKARHEF